jgi:DNA-binding SARP family transcriptional activator/tetratricopeptide (TPR) repeat protein
LPVARDDLPARTRFGLLGPLLIEDPAGQVIAVRAAKQRIVLAALLLSPNAVVSLEGLADALWDARPPQNAPAVVRTYVMRLRRALGDASARIVSQPAGYCLLLHEPADLDLAEVKHLQEAARAAAQDGQWQHASTVLDRALSMWRGAPLADVFSESLRSAELPRLQDLRLELAEARIEAALHLGRHGDVITELRALAAEHPLRERLRAQLMLACYRSGRQAEALEVYRTTRAALIGELGVEPGHELQLLHERILAGDLRLALTAPAPAAAPGVAPPGPARGTAVPGVPRQLPASIRHFTGRQAALAGLTRLADEVPSSPGTVVISAIGGAAGIGKTALALHWAHREAERFPGGQLYVNLRGFGPSGEPMSAAEATRGFLDSLGVPTGQMPAGQAAQAGLYRSRLAGRRMIIVLDNARDEEQVRPLLPAAPGCLVLVTSRNQLTGLAAAHGAQLISLDALTSGEAAELLTRRLGAERVAAEPEAAAALAARCAGLPLALNMVAARAAARPGFPLAALAAELRDSRTRLDALASSDTDADVRAAFTWSYRTLSAPAARIFRLLGLHPGPDQSAAAAASLGNLPDDQARALLEQLADAHLVVEHRPGRFSCHDLLRVYAAEQARATDSEADRRRATHRMLDHYLHSARAADLLLSPRPSPVRLPAPRPGSVRAELADRAQALAWLTAEHQALLAVTAYAADAGFETHAWQIPLFLGSYFDATAHWPDWAASQRIALAAAQRIEDRIGQASARHYLGYACLRLGSDAEAGRHLGQAAELFRLLGDRAGQARVHITLAISARQRGEVALALEHGQIARRLFRAARNRAGQATALNAIGWYHALLGHYADALGCCEQALLLYQELGNPAGEAATWDSLGYAHHRLGHDTDALACYGRAIAMFRAQGNDYFEAGSLRTLGEAQQASGNGAAARQSFQRALALLDRQRHPDADAVRASIAALAAGQ